jgi:hypothetical protein
MTDPIPDSRRVLEAYRDAAGLMLAAADDRQALDAVLKALTFRDAAKLLIGCLEVGASLVTVGDLDPDRTPRQLLTAFIAGANTVEDDELGGP